VSAGIHYNAIQVKYNLNTKSNISQIWSMREKYMAVYNDQTASPSRKTLKKTKLTYIDASLLKTHQRILSLILNTLSLNFLETL
jgi:hypothetical protein